MNITEIRARNIERARDHVQTTPSWWDRDCRCCLVLRLKDYHIKGGVRVITMADEEIHATHTDQEITQFMAEVS
jgi:hypothetical protein